MTELQILETIIENTLTLITSEHECILATLTELNIRIKRLIHAKAVTNE